MPKEKSSFSTLFRSWMKEIPPEEGKYFEIIGNQNVFCNVCSKNIKCTKKFELMQHIKTGLHVGSVKRSLGTVQTRVDSQKKLKDTFSQDLCNALLAADIPFNKIDNPRFKDFLESYCKRPVSSAWQLRNTQLQSSYDEIIENIRKELKDSYIWMGVDETTDKCGRFVANVMVGCLNGEEAKPHLLMSKELITANNATVTQLILDALHFLWPGKEGSEINKQFVLLLSDAAPYMIKTGKNLKKTYPGLLHITCLAHGIHRVAETIRSLFGNVDKLVASIKAVFKKSPYRVRKYNEMLPGLRIPPEPILTRWGTWLEAVEFMSANFSGVKSVIDSFDGQDAECIRKAQSYLSKSNINEQLADITTNYGCIIKAIKTLETRNLHLVNAVDVICEVITRLNMNPSQNGIKVKEKFEAVLGKNPDFQAMKLVAEVLKGNSNVNTGMDPSLITALKFCPITSVEVERGFSMEKAIFSDKRRNFTMKNLEMYLICHFELSVSCKNTENNE